MAIKRFVIEFEDEHACAVSRLDLWRVLREHFVEDLYISVNEICPTQDALDDANEVEDLISSETAILEGEAYARENASPVI